MIYDRDILNNNIRILMKDKNISQTDIAAEIGTYQSRVSDCLKGKKDFTLPQIISIANLFDVSVDELLANSNRQTLKIQSFSDIISLLFSLEKIISLYIKNECVELVYDDIDETVLVKGDHCLVFENGTMKCFLKEWHDAKTAFSRLTDSASLYETWKNGVLNKYAGHLKLYNFNTKAAYRKNLISQMVNISDNELLFKATRKQLKPWELEMLEEAEKKFPDLYEMPFLPDELFFS